jgi:hypothetical protein
LYDILRLLKNSGLFTSIELLKLVDEEVVRYIRFLCLLLFLFFFFLLFVVDFDAIFVYIYSEQRI